jgi:hypothetical protein
LLTAVLFASAAWPQSGSPPPAAPANVPAPSAPSAAPPASVPAQPAPPQSSQPAPVKPAAAKPGAAKPGAAKPVTSAHAKSAATPTRYLPNRFAGRAGIFYKSVWGVDMLSVKLTESGQIVRFTWRVLDPEKAKPLSDKVSQPSLIDPQAGVSLVVPTLENIGMMRQASTPEEGKSYWMAFSNKGRIVKKGDRVNVVIGQFRADGLAVDD